MADPSSRASFRSPGSGRSDASLHSRSRLRPENANVTIREDRSKPHTAPSSQYRLLWIDDEPLLMGGLAEFLREEGLAVEFAVTGAEGVRMSAAARYDAILLDLNLPDMPGMQVLKRVRAGTYAPIIVITGYGSIDSAVDALRTGAAHYKSKPLRAAVLLEAIQSVIHSSRALRSRPTQFREARGGGAAVAVADLIHQLDETIASDSMQQPVDWRTTRNALSARIARAAVNPELTLPEFCAVGDALRMVAIHVHPPPGPTLHRIRDCLELASRADWTGVDGTLQRLLDRLEAAGKASVRLNESVVASELGLTSDALSRSLGHQLGLSFRQLRRAVAMRRAIQMISASREQVAQIAYAVGYEHASGFDRSFTATFGLSPNAFRGLFRRASLPSGGLGSSDR